jgi:hypothetical protein
MKISILLTANNSPAAAVRLPAEGKGIILSRVTRHALRF